jgi:hypothetical protein
MQKLIIIIIIKERRKKKKSRSISETLQGKKKKLIMPRFLISGLPITI